MLKLNKNITRRDHQVTAHSIITGAIAAGNGELRARATMPTGAGKSITQADIAVFNINTNTVSGLTMVSVPTIALAQQMAEEFNSVITGHFNTISFNSGEMLTEVTDKFANYLGSTTDVAVALEAHKKANGPTIIFTTYASMPELVGVDFDLLLADEAQKLVGESRNEAWQALSGRVRLTFTATERHTEDPTGRGLNNVAVFGKKLVNVSAAEMIAKGYIVAPELHVISFDSDTDNKGKTDDTVISQMIAAARKQVESGDATIGSSKILFATEGSAHVALVNKEHARFTKAYKNHTVFTCTSKTGFRVNDKKVSRSVWFKILKKTDNALIFHYNMLSEGIDVDGITGVVLMRKLAHDTLVQTIGRAVRIFKADPSKKTYAMVTAMVCNNDDETANIIERTVAAIKDQGSDVSKTTVEVAGGDTNKPKKGDKTKEFGLDTGISNIHNKIADTIKTNAIDAELAAKSEEDVFACNF